MKTLGDNLVVRENIRRAPAKVIKVLHSIVFEEQGDRKNRMRLRNFSGFEFTRDDESYHLKMTYIKEKFSLTELVSVCNLLNVECTGEGDEVTERVLTYLMDVEALPEDGDEDDDEEDEEVEDEKDGEEDEHEDSKREDDEEEDASQADRNTNGRKDDNTKKIKSVTRMKSVIPKTTINKEVATGVNRKSTPTPVKFMISFRDVEDSIRPYDGSDDIPVKKWVEDFEETAALMGWDELQKLVFAKKSLRGTAKLFVQGERDLTTFIKLKRALIDEFAEAVNSAVLHKKLSTRKMLANESEHEYFLTMREIAARGPIDDEALIQYVIDGIRGEDSKKVILYGASTIGEFKTKLKVYKTMKSRFDGITKQNKSSTIEKEKSRIQSKQEDSPGEGSGRRCFNCGAKGHVASNCDRKKDGMKCFKCNEFGHIASACTKKVEMRQNRNAKASVNNVRLDNSNRMKVVMVQNVRCNALVDTGCDVNIIREDLFEKMKPVSLQSDKLTLTGFGSELTTKPMGFFYGTILIDGEEFPVKIYVVRINSMQLQAIIGNDLLNQAKVTISADGIKVEKETKEEAQVMQILVEQVEDEFPEEVKKLLVGYTPKEAKHVGVEMKITLLDETKEIVNRPTRLSWANRVFVEQQVDAWLKEGIIEPCYSEFSSPVVVVKKKDGCGRLCIDFRKLNSEIVKDRYPLPLIEDVLDRLADAKIFSRLDLRNGFFHVPVEESSRKYTAFVVNDGQYQFRKMPFGLCNSPAVFQRYINCIFRQLSREGKAFTYMDDVIVPAEDEFQAVKKLEDVIKVTQDHGLELNLKKCSFLKRRIEFLGHVIEDGKIYPSPEKIRAVMKFPEPRTIKQVQSFLGLTGYFRKFMPRYAEVAKPMSNMLRKDVKFHIGEAERRSFELLKKLLAEEPVLHIYNRSSETELHTDASAEGYGAVLLQKCPQDNQFHPVSYMSKKTTPSECKYSSYELEVLAIMYALEKYRTYLLGTNFKIVTDCSAFEKTMKKRDLPPRISRWAMKLQEYQYTLEHRAGVKMKHVDALSRAPVMPITTRLDTSIKLRIQKAQENDAELEAIRQLLKAREYENYAERNGVLYKFVDGNEVIVVPKSLQIEVIRRVHENGHGGTKVTGAKLKQEFYFPNMQEKMKKVIQNCIPCILANKKQGLKEGFLQPRQKGSVPLQTYHVDHLGPIASTSKNYAHIFAVIDAFSKFVWLYPVKSTTAKETIAKLDQQKKNFGNPEEFITDKGSCFTSDEFKNYCNEQKIKHSPITTGLPRANGQVERLNRSIIPILTKLAIDDPTKWYKHVDDVQRILNSSYQRSVGRTPFEIMFGVPMKNKEDLKIRAIIEEELMEEFCGERDEIRKEAKEQILKVQEENRKTYNRKRKTPVNYKKGDMVAIKRTQFGPGLKFRTKYLGPYQITEVKPGGTYNVKRMADTEGPRVTSSCDEYLKPWVPCNEDSSEADEPQDGRV